MADYVCNGWADFQKQFKKFQLKLKRDIVAAVHKTGRRGEKVVAKNIPIAFGELERGLSTILEQANPSQPYGKAEIQVKAPHALAVEYGSRPHMPPLAPILAWVKLRGAQAYPNINKARPRGPTGRAWAAIVATQLKGYEIRASRKANTGRYSPVDAPEILARRIQISISKVGTRPQFYMSKSFYEVCTILDEEIQDALNKNG